MDPERWQKVKRLTADAIELEAGERPSFLEQACTSDPALRREVERLLREHENPAGLSELIDSSPLAAPPWGRPNDLTVTKVGRGSRDTSESGLAPNLVKRSGERLSALALAYAILYFVINLLNELFVHVGGDLPYRQADHWPSQAVMTALIVVCLTIHYLLRTGRIAGPTVIAVGLWFEIIGTLGMTLGTYGSSFPEDTRIAGASWMCIWIVAYPFLVPSPPGRATAAAFASAATVPLTVAALVGAGAYDRPSTQMLLATFIPLFICALIAAVGARIIYRLGTELRRAQELGSYRLESRIGHGGMGEVWVARHRTLARPAALKLIRPEMLWHESAGGSAVERFEREAQHTAELTSPHTVELYDYGTTDEGVFYYAMELLDGLDLESLVRRFGAVPPERAVHFLEQVCQSLAEAHERGLVHRDIKPANVYVCRQGLVLDFVKVLDFGLVQRQREGEASSDPRNGHVDIAGTPGYMAPECLAGSEAGPRSDLYALGCVAYRLLTGGPAFTTDSEGEKAPPAPPSERTGQRIPATLDRIVLQCLESAPSLRPPGASQLRAALLEVAFDEPWTQNRARAWWATARATTAPSTPESTAAPA